jgi:adenylate cyclase
VGLAQALSFGTDRYPGKVARRLRVFNFACWSSALVWLIFAVLYFPEPKLRTVAGIDFAMAVIVAAIPVLHRFGPRAAAIAFAVVSLPATLPSVSCSAPTLGCRCISLYMPPVWC